MKTPKFILKDENFGLLKEIVVKEIGQKKTLKIPVTLSLKAFFIFLLFCLLLISFWNSNNLPITYIIISIFLGISCLPLILNIGHEAVHGNLSNFKIINKLGSQIFYFLGTSTYFWRLRHISSHHIFTNVKNWDLDIEQSKIIRLSEAQPWKTHHAFQPYYMGLAFLFYTLNWFLFRDFKDVFKKQFGTQNINQHPIFEILLLIISKIWHFAFLIFIPIYLGASLPLALIGFFAFHVSASAATTFALISTHIGENQEVISIGSNNSMPYTWLEHQLKTTSDFATQNTFYLHFFGGFNHHIAHHLFPTYPHFYYPKITEIIKEFCKEKNLSYSSYPNLTACMRSHFWRLKKYSHFDMEL